MNKIHNIKKLYIRRKYLRNNATNEEALLWLKLKNSQLGFKFRRQHSVGGYIADFYCPTQKLILEIDGINHFLKENIEYDKIRTEFLNKLGIRVLRFSNLDINNNIEEVLLRIKDSFTTPLAPSLIRRGSK